MKSSAVQEEFLLKIEKMYSEYTVEDIRCHMEPDFRYSSFWVLPEMTSAKEYIEYITEKVKTLKEINSVVTTRMMHFEDSGELCLVLKQDSVSEAVCLIVERSANGLIARMDMMPAGFYKLL